MSRAAKIDDTPPQRADMVRALTAAARLLADDPDLPVPNQVTVSHHASLAVSVSLRMRTRAAAQTALWRWAEAVNATPNKPQEHVQSDGTPIHSFSVYGTVRDLRYLVFIHAPRNVEEIEDERPVIEDARPQAVEDARPVVEDAAPGRVRFRRRPGR
jgi:hypothetical protein